MKKRFWTLCVFVVATLWRVDVSIADEKSYRVANPSFEETNDFGGALDWYDASQTFVVATGEARSGNASLKWTGNASKNELCMQTVDDVEPGDIVEFSVWVKTKDLTGGYASICVEWGRQDGSWLGGEFAKGVDGTTDDWTKVSGWTRVPEDAANPHVALYVTESSSGSALFDDVEIKRYDLQLFTGMTTDRYRAQSIGGTVDVYVGYTRTVKNVDFKTLHPELTIVGEDGAKSGAALVEAADDYYRFSFDSSALSAGKYTLTASMV
ncbi:MAG: hypothetical protein IKX88_12145, partial [Thermoguttaceae bacterium]|nr:hypothetical protein [Thermoguttaceae bacterium]